MSTALSIVRGGAVDVDWRGRRSGSGLCWGATRRGIAGRKLKMMPTPTGAAPGVAVAGRGSALGIIVDFRIP